MRKRILGSIVSALLGLMFLFSAYSKLNPVEPFEYTFVDAGLLNWTMAPFAARVLIGLEFFVGILLLFNIGWKKFAYRFAGALLIVFSVYLVLTIAFSGNKGNCGCFGSWFSMTPLEALIKNSLAFLLLLWLNKNQPGWMLDRNLKLPVLFLLIGSIAFPMINNPIELNYAQAYLQKKQDQFSMEIDTLYKYATVNPPPKSLSEGKHLIAFFSLTCKHCRIAATKLRIIHERNPNLPMYFVLNGKAEKEVDFFEDTKTENIPHTLLNGRAFVYLAGTNLPAIYLVNNGIVEHDLNYFILDQTELEEWFRSK